MNEGEVGKIEKQKVLNVEITNKWGMKWMIKIVDVEGALGAITTGFKKYVTAIGMNILQAARTQRLVLECET